MPNIAQRTQRTTPTLFTTVKPGAPRPWLMSETPTLFSLANIGSYNQRLVNQLLSVCSELSHHVSFLPILSFLSLRDMEHRETLYANGQPFVHTATLEGVDIYDRQPSAAETTLVGEMLATIRYYQAVPVLSYSIITSMLRRCMDELETFSDAAGCLVPEVDTHGKPQWYSYSETATYYGLSGGSADYWDVIELLDESMQAYAADKELTLDA